MTERAGADLHLHSHFSDGDWSPRKVVEAARREGLSTIALTDHDTVDGVAEAIEAGEKRDIEVIAGAEISTWNGRDLHLLAYGFDLSDIPLREILARAQDERRDRAAAMVAKLNELGMEISMEDVLAEVGEGAIGRPHVARALTKRGRVPSYREAFDLWLGDGKPACVDKYRLSPADAVELVHGAGGVIVVAHPRGLDGLDELVALGVDGVEAWHPMHDPEQSKELVRFAASHDLLTTGGSDFHGPRASGLTVGSVSVPAQQVERLRDRIDSRTRLRNRAVAGGGA